jgi:hypothetical protein
MVMDGLNLFILTTKKSALDAWQNAIKIILRILLNAECVMVLIFGG